MSDGEGGFWAAIGFAFLVGVLAAFMFYNLGHDQGVKDGISGAYVVVKLPDGRVVVVENKESSK